MPTNPAKNPDLKRPSIISKSPDHDRFPDELTDLIADEVRRNPNFGEQSSGGGVIVPIKVYVDYPMTWRQVKEQSRFMTANEDYPVLILPQVREGNHDKHIRDSPYSGYYCSFEAQVTLVRTDNDKNAVFEIARTVERFEKKTGEHESYGLQFSDEAPTKGFYQPELSFKLSKHVYQLQTDGMNIIAFSEIPLELGMVYRIGGMMWSASDKKNTKAINFHDVYMLVDWAVPARNLADTNEDFFRKFRGLDHRTIVDSCAFPFENSIDDYKELSFLAVFNVRAGTVPLNIMIMGTPGCTKSAFMKRMASISGDTMYDGGSTTLKGLLPSFSPKALTAGAISTARHFVLVNEFFEIVKTAQHMEGGYDVLSKLKMLLEGEITPCTSGNGSMEVRMRGATFMASNWIEFHGSTRLCTVNEFYSKLDPALLDRLLVYPVNQRLQNKLVNQHSARVKERMKQFSKSSTLKDEIKLIEKMPTPYPLNTYDLRTILVFKDRLVPQMKENALQQLIRECAELQSVYSYEKYTRAQDFITNIASAYALERALCEGKVHMETREIEIIDADVRAAASYYRLVIERHSGKMENFRGQRREFYDNSATKPQKWVLDTLKEAYKNGVTREFRSVETDVITAGILAHYPESDPGVTLRALIEQKIIVWDGQRLMWLPDKLEDAALSALLMAGGALLQYVDILYPLSLVDGVGLEGKVEVPWIFDTPPMPSEEVRKLVRELCSKPRTIQEIKVAAKETEVDSAIYAMHLGGELRCHEGRYETAPKADMKKGDG